MNTHEKRGDRRALASTARLLADTKQVVRPRMTGYHHLESLLPVDSSKVKRTTMSMPSYKRRTSIDSLAPILLCDNLEGTYDRPLPMRVGRKP
jgi:hypothetical protein